MVNEADGGCLIYSNLDHNTTHNALGTTQKVQHTVRQTTELKHNNTWESGWGVNTIH